MAGEIPEIDNGWGIPEIEIDGLGDSRDRDRDR